MSPWGNASGRHRGSAARLSCSIYGQNVSKLIGAFLIVASIVAQLSRQKSKIFIMN